MTRASFDSVLIANRGEVAVRIARSCRALGLRVVAVASDADREAPYTRVADSVVAIGGARPIDSYLRIDRLIDAARSSGAQAVHPGYGFLAESAAFAQAVIDAGLVWIGPPPAAMAAMADKALAKQRLAAAGIPVLPGVGDDAEETSSPQALRAAARGLGVPLMVKARAGGGGRGMRLVDDLAQLDAAVKAAAAEALAAFGDARLLVERALVAPRHIEVQVFADAHGGVIHLGERDCSVQRRHQKIVEEAPSPAVSPALRRRLGAVAVAAARAVGYVGAGTVEFLLETGPTAAERFWFMEMNTRLQVEHPLTEALVGVDLVEWQLRIAAGEPLPLSQDDALARYEAGGHAIEVRLCAEDPARDHLPQTGVLRLWHPPHGVRCDHALASGCTVGPHYDSMLAKLIAHAPQRSPGPSPASLPASEGGDREAAAAGPSSVRDAAIRRLADALERTVCLGVATNRGFLARVLRHPAFARDDVTTAFLETHFAAPATRTDSVDTAWRALVAAAVATLPATALPALWAGWTSSHHVDTRVPLGIGEHTETWHLEGSPTDLTARCGDAVHRVEGLARDSRSSVRASVDGRPLAARAAQAGSDSWWLCGGTDLAVRDLRLAGAATARTGAAAGALHAPMHGRLTQVLAVAGERVAAGALLLVIEAMKMEHQIHAPFAGLVTAVHAGTGAQVAARQLLLELVP